MVDFSQKGPSISWYDRLWVLYRRVQHLVQYCMIGCLGAGMDFVLYTLLIEQTSLHYQVVNIFSTSVGICNNFIWNAFLNFKVWNHFFLRFCSFYCVGAIGILITSGCLYLLIECLDWNKIAAKVITIFLVTAVQFLLNKYITFKKKSY